MGLLEGVFDCQRMEVEVLQNGQGGFGRLGGEVHPEQSTAVSKKAAELGGGDVCADRLVGREKQCSDHEICLQSRRKLRFWTSKINNLEESIEIFDLHIDKIDFVSIILLEIRQ
jgi:hypothetical protein